MKRIVLLNLSLVFCLTLTKAQDTLWTLDRCVKYAIENNISVKQKQLDVDIAKETVIASKADFLPSLNGSFENGYNWGRKVNSYTNEISTSRTFSSSLGLSSSVTLFHAFELKNSLKRDEFNLSARLSDIEKLKNDISLNVASTFLQIMYYSEMLNISKEQVTLSEAQTERTRLLVDAGKSTRGNLLEIQAQQEQDILQVVTDENNLNTSYLTLRQLLEIRDTLKFQLQFPNISLLVDERPLNSVDSIFQFAMNNLPEFKSAEYDIKKAQMSAAVASSYRYPSLTLSGGYYTGYSDARKKINPTTLAIEDYPYSSQLSDNQSKSLSLTLSVPIFNKLSVETSIRKAKIGVAYAETNYQLTANLVYKDIQKAWNDAHAAFRKYIASGKVVEASTESFSYSEQKFNAGVVTAIDYNTVKTQLSKVKTELLQAKYDYVFRLAVLDYYMGKPIKI